MDNETRQALLGVAFAAERAEVATEALERAYSFAKRHLPGGAANPVVVELVGAHMAARVVLAKLRMTLARMPAAPVPLTEPKR